MYWEVNLEHFVGYLIFNFLCTMAEMVSTTFILQSVITLYNIEKSCIGRLI